MEVINNQRVEQRVGQPEIIGNHRMVEIIERTSNENMFFYLTFGGCYSMVNTHIHIAYYTVIAAHRKIDLSKISVQVNCSIFFWVLQPIGSMVLPYMVTWIPSIYPLYVSIYTSTMDPSWVMDLYSFWSGFMGQFSAKSLGILSHWNTAAIPKMCWIEW